MIVLDTNVLSETLRPKPSANVLIWMRSEPVSSLFTTTITEAELLYGSHCWHRGNGDNLWRRSWV